MAYTNGVLLVAHHRCAINGHTRCAISRGFSSSASVLGSSFLIIRNCPGLSFATKRIGPPSSTLVTLVTCYPLRIILSHNYLLLITSVLAENTLLKTTCHFLLLLVGFDTLTYRNDYVCSSILVGHQDSFLAPFLGSEAPLVNGIW